MKFDFKKRLDRPVALNELEVDTLYEIVGGTNAPVGTVVITRRVLGTLFRLGPDPLDTWSKPQLSWGWEFRKLDPDEKVTLSNRD